MGNRVSMRKALLVGLEAYACGHVQGQPQFHDLEHCAQDVLSLLPLLQHHGPQEGEIRGKPNFSDIQVAITLGGFNNQTGSAQYRQLIEHYQSTPQMFLHRWDTPFYTAAQFENDLEVFLGDKQGNVNSTPAELFLIYIAAHGYRKDAMSLGELVFCHPESTYDTYPLEKLIQRINQVHNQSVLLVLDCCHAGAFFTLKDKTVTVGAQKAIIASCDAGQRSEDHSAFAEAFRNGLEGQATVDHEGKITFGALTEFMDKKLQGKVSPIPISIAFNKPLRIVSQQQMGLQSSAIPPLSSMPSDIRNIKEDMERFIESQLLDHEPHDIETEFKHFFETRQRGFWLLTAGPGVGKTSIMAQLARSQDWQTKSKPHLCIPYFFRSEHLGQEGNNAEDYYQYVVKYLLWHYGLTSACFTNKALGEEEPCYWSEKFKVLLGKLDDSGVLNRKKPIVLLIDALDEMDNGYYSQLEKNINPLKLPARLPEGVFIAYSVRSNPSDYTNRLLNIPKEHTQITLNAKHRAHQNTVKHYVLRQCRTQLHLKQFIKDNYTEPEVNAVKTFTTSICNDTDYNFMILRCALHEKRRWSGNDAFVGLTKDLWEYYEDHLRRMTHTGSEGINARAVYCFILQARMSQFLLLRLLRGKAESDSAVGHTAFSILKQWVGLVLEFKEQWEWYSVYHRTYREFLVEKIENQNLINALYPSLEKLVAGIALDGKLEAILDEYPQIQQEWLILLLRLLLRTENSSILEKALNNIHLWNLAIKCNDLDGLGMVFQELNDLKLTNEANQQAFEQTFKQVAEKLFIWADQGCLGTQKRLTGSQVASTANDAKHSRNSFSKYVRRPKTIESSFHE